MGKIRHLRLLVSFSASSCGITPFSRVAALPPNYRRKPQKRSCVHLLQKPHGEGSHHAVPAAYRIEGSPSVPLPRISPSRTYRNSLFPHMETSTWERPIPKPEGVLRSPRPDREAFSAVRFKLPQIRLCITALPYAFFQKSPLVSSSTFFPFTLPSGSNPNNLRAHSQAHFATGHQLTVRNSVPSNLQDTVKLFPSIPGPGLQKLFTIACLGKDISHCTWFLLPPS